MHLPISCTYVDFLTEWSKFTISEVPIIKLDTSFYGFKMKQTSKNIFLTRTAKLIIHFEKSPRKTC